jgi:hypothetical protein
MELYYALIFTKIRKLNDFRFIASHETPSKELSN